MEQRRRAVDLYVRFDCSAADTIRELGYPSKGALLMWHRDRLVEERTGMPVMRGERYGRYTVEQKQAAVEFYLSHGRNLRRTMRHMGYPSHEVLAAWIDELAPGERRIRVGEVPVEQRTAAVRAVVAGVVRSRQVAAGLGVRDATVRNWKRLPATAIRESDMRTPKDVRGSADDGRDGELARLREQNEHLRERIRSLTSDPKTLRKEIRDLEVEVDILKTTKELLGKGRGVDPANLTAREKSILIRGVHERTHRSVAMLVRRLGLPRSVYYYQLQALARPDRNAPVLGLIRDAFTASRQRYGYRRIHLELRSAGVIVSAKRIMRLMTTNGIIPLFKSSRRYSSYQGEISKAPKNLVARNFHAVNANQLWVTDITEMSIPAGKVYLSPIIDCYDGMPVAWTIGTSPNARLTNTMLQQACTTLQPGQTPTIHSDRGCHYRWPEWIRICREHGLTRSMSAKGCSPDNAAAEGFFGRLKQEFYHQRDFTGTTTDRFMAALDEYLTWYRDKRIKTQFGMSITAKRRELGLMA